MGNDLTEEVLEISLIKQVEKTLNTLLNIDLTFKKNAQI